MTGEFHCKQPNDRGELLEDEDAERSGGVTSSQSPLLPVQIAPRGRLEAGLPS
jgi:hypothetical protein